MAERKKDTSQLQLPLDNSQSVDELLLENILKEYAGEEILSPSSMPEKDTPAEQSEDEKVQKILEAIQSTLSEEDRVSRDARVAEPAGASVDEPDQSRTQLSEPGNQEEPVNPIEAVQPDEPIKKNKKEKAREQKPQVKVVPEEDAHPLFGDDFAKYFGPEAGLATQIELGDLSAEDEEEEDISDLKKPLFPWKRRKKPRDPEPSGPEEQSAAPQEENLNPEQAIKGITAAVGYSRLRLTAAALFMLPLLYITFAPRFSWFLPDFLIYYNRPFIYLLVLTALQVAISMLCVETVAVGFYDLLRLRPNVESVVALSALLSILHTVSIIAFPQWEGYYPYAVVSCLSLVLATYYRQKFKMARLRSYKALSAMHKPYVVVAEKGVYSGADAIVKYRTSEATYFVNQTENNDINRRVWAFASPLLLLMALIAAIISSVGQGNPQRFLWIYSGIMATAAPFSLFVPYYLPFSKIAKYLGNLGEAIAGWSAAEEFDLADSIIISDADLFPAGSISLNGLKVFGGVGVDKVISYSASLISASGAGTSKPFLELLHDQSTTMRKVVNFRHYENGGIGGEINGESVVAGSDSFMLRTGIKIPRNINIKHAIYVAINHELAGIFAVNYNMTNSVRKAIAALQKNQITPVLAIRDFNISPAMIESKLNISTDTADYPPIEDRLYLSNPDRMYFGKPSAVVSREGINHYADSILCARNLKKSSIIGLVLNFICITAGMLLMFYFFYTHSAIQATPSNLLLYFTLWLLPNLLSASRVNP